MAEAVAIFLITELAGAALAGGIVLSVTTTIVGIGLSIGASLLAAQFLGPKKPEASPMERQFINRSPVSPRTRSYGRVRVGGAQAFLDEHANGLYRVLAHGEGPIDAVEEHLIGETVVALDGDGWVISPSHLAYHIYIHNRLGTSAPAAYTGMVNVGWDGSELGRGVVTSMTYFGAGDQDTFRNRYPQGENTSYKQTQRAAKIWDPRDLDQDPDDPATWAWSDNAALIVLDYLRHATGFAMPDQWFLSDIEDWKEQADISYQPVALKDGGFTPRYRLWGTYSYSDRPGDVLERLLSACNGRLMNGANGGLVLRVGYWTEPTVTIGSAAIVGFDVGAGNDGPSTAKVLRATYTEPALGYSEADAAPWSNSGVIDEAGGGLQTADAQLYFVPSHSQCRRLMKQAAVKLAPVWRGTITTNLLGLPAMTERFVWIELEDLAASFTAEIDDADFVIQDGIVTGLRLMIVATPAESFAWDAATEEGDAPEAPPATGSGVLGLPGNFGVFIEASGADVVAVAHVDLLDPADMTDVRVRVAGTDTWALLPRPAAGIGMVETPPLTAAAVYEFQARSVRRDLSAFGLSGLLSGYPSWIVSNWTATVTRTATVDAVAPSPPVDLSATNYEGPAVVAWTQPASANTYAARVYWSQTNAPAGAGLLVNTFAGTSAVLAHTHASPLSGDNYYWVAAVNGSGVESARTAAGSITI